MKRIQELGRFIVRTDGGREYTVVETQEFISTASFENPDGEVAGMKDLTTTTGLHLNFIDNQTFKIVATGEIVRRV